MKTLEEVRAYCAAKRGATASYPFGEQALVYKVGEKMFALVGERNQRLEINVKCDPDWALALRDMFTAVEPGYHMNKRHWNTVVLDGSIPSDEVCAMIDHSYELVFKRLTKAQRDTI